MIEIGHYNTLKVAELVDFGAYLTDGHDQVLLPSKWVTNSLAEGDELEVFVYTDSEDRPIATLEQPKAQVGEFALLEVVDSTRYGAFVDWGLSKDLLVPFAEQEPRLSVGDWAVFYIDLNNQTNRPVASNRLNRHFDYNVEHINENVEVDLMVYGHNQAGSLVVVNGRHRGIIYHDQTFKHLSVGERVTGFVATVREDNRIDVTLTRRGHGGTLDAKEIILEKIKAAGGTLHLHDKSHPDEIKAMLQMSKKRFKAALGGLYKEGAIVFFDGGIKLADDSPA